MPRSTDSFSRTPVTFLITILLFVLQTWDHGVVRTRAMVRRAYPDMRSVRCSGQSCRWRAAPTTSFMPNLGLGLDVYLDRVYAHPHRVGAAPILPLRWDRDSFDATTMQDQFCALLSYSVTYQGSNSSSSVWHTLTHRYLCTISIRYFRPLPGLPHDKITYDRQVIIPPVGLHQRRGGVMYQRLYLSLYLHPTKMSIVRHVSNWYCHPRTLPDTCNVNRIYSYMYEESICNDMIAYSGLYICFAKKYSRCYLFFIQSLSPCESGTPDVTEGVNGVVWNSCIAMDAWPSRLYGILLGLITSIEQARVILDYVTLPTTSGHGRSDPRGLAVMNNDLSILGSDFAYFTYIKRING